MATTLSDRALSVFAFAIYHQLESGEPVTAVVRRDAAGHQANPGAVDELQQAGLVTAEPDRLLFTPQGQEVLASLVDAMRQSLS